MNRWTEPRRIIAALIYGFTAGAFVRDGLGRAKSAATATPGTGSALPPLGFGPDAAITRPGASGA